MTSGVPEVFVDFKSIAGEDHKRVLSKQYGYLELLTFFPKRGP